MNFIVIFVGGGIGAVTRYFLSKFINDSFNSFFPLGTLLVNLAGCLIIGILYGLFEKYVIPHNIRLFIFVGFLGGFTTFSSYGLETINLLKSNEYKSALLNIFISNIAGLTLVYFGSIITSLFTKK